MALTRLGTLIEQTDERNGSGRFGPSDLKGISIEKILIPTKADTNGLNLSNYKIVRHNEFVLCTVTSRNGEKVSLAYNDSDDCIVSGVNLVFKVKSPDLLPRYLMMYFNRSEFDRYARFNSWGSARETFDWDDLCNIVIDLPPIEIQRKYVAIYEALLANLRVYEEKLDDLKLVCDGYIEGLKKKYPLQPLGLYLEQYKETNAKLTFEKLAGLIGGEITEPRNVTGQENLERFQVAYPGSIAYPPPHFGEVGTIGIVEREPVLLSPMYVVFRTKNPDKLNPYYALLWFRRNEFLRFAFFAASDSIRDTFDFDKLARYEAPIPPIEIQNSIVNISHALNERKQLVERLKNTLLHIAPVLIKGSIEEAKGL